MTGAEPCIQMERGKSIWKAHSEDHELSDVPRILETTSSLDCATIQVRRRAHDLQQALFSRIPDPQEYRITVLGDGEDIPGRVSTVFGLRDILLVSDCSPDARFYLTQPRIHFQSSQSTPISGSFRTATSHSCMDRCQAQIYSRACIAAQCSARIPRTCPTPHLTMVSPARVVTVTAGVYVKFPRRKPPSYFKCRL